MIITLDLPHELENELSDEAARLGIPLLEYTMRILATGRPARQAPTTGVELVEYWQNEGLVGSRPDIGDSQEHARLLRQVAQRRRRE